ncbi:protein DENND6B isoform X5 [Hippopotamus amphibius kiboko]|uniref:protein DENND6B isoform X5 n=1 Tax=Hippopotamus amphibius kiboko TaxID=575201 RepID=UPI002598769A|nr:protein DENND6B isoform X5 [Hippopotamus amphibius kiboko]
MRCQGPAHQEFGFCARNAGSNWFRTPQSAQDVCGQGGPTDVGAQEPADEAGVRQEGGQGCAPPLSRGPGSAALGNSPLSAPTDPRSPRSQRRPGGPGCRLLPQASASFQLQLPHCRLKTLSIFRTTEGPKELFIWCTPATSGSRTRRKAASATCPSPTPTQCGGQRRPWHTDDRHCDRGAPASLQREPAHYFGYVYFRQVKDSSLKRGYFQKGPQGLGRHLTGPRALQSLVLVSRLPFVRLFQALLGLVAPEFFDKLAPCLEAACREIDQWPAPVPGRTLNLPVMGVVLQVRLAGWGGMARCLSTPTPPAAASFVPRTCYRPRWSLPAPMSWTCSGASGRCWRTCSCCGSSCCWGSRCWSWHPRPPCPRRWCWPWPGGSGRRVRGVARHQPCSLTGPAGPPAAACSPSSSAATTAPTSPSTTASSRSSPRARRPPLAPHPPCRGAQDVRGPSQAGQTEKALEAEDPGHQARSVPLLSSRDPETGLGVGWGRQMCWHRQREGSALPPCPPQASTPRTRPTSTETRPCSDGCLRYRWGGAHQGAGHCARHVKGAQPGRCGSALAPQGLQKKRPSDAQTAVLRRHLLELTQSFIIPLEHYMASLMPLQKSIAPWKTPPQIRPFRQDDFLRSLEHAGPQLTCVLKGDWLGLYRPARGGCLLPPNRRFFKSPHFDGWYRQRHKEMAQKLEALHLEAICEAVRGLGGGAPGREGTGPEAGEGLGQGCPLSSPQNIEIWMKDKSEVEVVDLVLKLQERLVRAQGHQLPVKEATLKRARLYIETVIGSLPKDLQVVLCPP